MTDAGDRAHATTRKSGRPRRRAYPVIATQSAAARLANRLSAAGVVLPFIAVALGGPLLAAALIYPVFTIARLTGVVATPAMLANGRSSKALLGLTGAGTAVLIAANALGSQLIGAGMAFAFVVTAGVLGFLAGVSTVCWFDVVAGSLAQHELSRLPVLQSWVAAALVLVISGVDWLVFAETGGPYSHVRLLWWGAAAMVVAAAICLLIEAATEQSRTRARLLDTLRRGHHHARHTSWVRRYLVVQTLFLTVSLGSAFYSAHGATIHGGIGGSLRLIVAVTSVGLLVFALVWVPMRPRIGLRGVYWLGGCLGFFAASLCAMVDLFELTSSAWIYGVILAAAAASALAVSTAKQVWLLRTVTTDRLVIIGFNQLVVGTVSALLGAMLAVVAHLHGAIWPVYLVLVLDALAVTTIRWVPPLRMVEVQGTGRASAA
jgi:hypothetical protein